MRIEASGWKGYEQFDGDILKGAPGLFLGWESERVREESVKLAQASRLNLRFLF